ncbi:hypothetical protein GGI25_003651 [Coemansia spiralis]|uniref:Uncharacterized protein n=2 Tax=Coemansia TaxID=4863 RepID=A0A9W8G624_9FUNG|nr:hypothetical protein BX070DRAFT_251190 [Coemansia spiralis]KAJ1996119.1 hypothetical protein EDC05_000009 [Coemansia umbellata]KAJ2626123.1 hypothetical protein GGI26_000207 [Coemansia sp. RSA 1358]KAJ2676264.1 hypothetical protein GGI25_003651 [Coemansia spiralis]
MKIFDGQCAWFASNVPQAHINTWIADGGVHIRDPTKPQIHYYFSNQLDRDSLLLVRRDKVLYRSLWITDSSLSRTKQPLGAYVLGESSARPFKSPPSHRPLGRNNYYQDREHSVRDNMSETQSIVSSRHSASSLSHTRRQAVSRFTISMDQRTRNSILADAVDFTPNNNGFVAYKIPKLT